MNKVKQCLIVVSDILDPTPMYENGYKFLSRCGMHFVSLNKVLYSIYCDNVLKKNPTHDEVASLTQCNQSLVPDGEQMINNTNKMITKYAINEGLKYYTEFMANNSRNFQVENMTSDTILPNYGHDFCKVLPYDCNSVPVGEYINKTLSILNNGNHSNITQEDSCYYWSYLMLGVTMVAATGYAVYHYWSYKSAQEDVFVYYQPNLNRMDNLQAQRPQNQGIMESIVHKYVKIDVCEAEISDKNLATNKFYPQIYGGTTSEVRECYGFVDGAIGNSASDRDNYTSSYQMWDAAFSDKNLTANELRLPIYSSISSRLYRYYETTAEPVYNLVADKDVSNTTYITPGEAIRGQNLATDNYSNISKCINNMHPNAIYREAYDTACIANHEESAYMLPVDEN